jgi:serine/threonine-protein kinase
VFVAGASMAAWLFSADHVATSEERLLLTQAVREALFQAGLVWLLYLALEPYVRRRWPHTLIAWSRLLDGRFRDPVVARDVLVGLTGALLLHVFLTTLTVWDRDAAVGMIAGQSLLPLSSLNRFAGWLVESLLFVEVAMGLFFLMVVARAVLRNDWLAAAILLLLVAVPGVLMRQPLLTFAGTIIYLATLYVLSVRVGLLALAIAGWMGHMLSLPLTTDANAWHAGYGYVLIAIPVLLGFIAFVYAKAGRPLGRIDLLQ